MGSAGGEIGGDEQAELRKRREEQLRMMDDTAFASEVRQHQAARWRPASLRSHARKHWQDFEALLGHGLAPSWLSEVSLLALYTWDRIFTEMDRQGSISYAFASRLTTSGAILVVITRQGLIPTAIPMPSVEDWLMRHKAAVEVSNRARRLSN